VTNDRGPRFSLGGGGGYKDRNEDEGDELKKVGHTCSTVSDVYTVNPLLNEDFLYAQSRYEQLIICRKCGQLEYSRTLVFSPNATTTVFSLVLCFQQHAHQHRKSSPSWSMEFTIKYAQYIVCRI
jgi:hypothetical protein